MPDEGQDLSGYSREMQDKILAHRAKEVEKKRIEEENKVGNYRTGRTLLAIGMALIMFGGPVGIVAGLFLVFYSISFDSANLGFGCVAIVIVLFILIGAFFTMLL